MRFTSYAIQKRRTEVHSPRGQSISQVLYDTNLGTQNFLFVPCPRDTAHPGSGPAQSLLSLCSGLLTSAHLIPIFQHRAVRGGELL